MMLQLKNLFWHQGKQIINYHPSLSAEWNHLMKNVLSFPIPFFLTLSLFFRPTFPSLFFPHSVLSFSCFTLFRRTLFYPLLFCQPPSPYPPIALVSIVSPPYTLRILCLSASILWSLPFIRCPFPFRVLIWTSHFATLPSLIPVGLSSFTAFFLDRVGGAWSLLFTYLGIGQFSTTGESEES